DVVGADVSRRRRQRLSDPSADDEQVLVNDAGVGETHRLCLWVTVEITSEIDPTVVAEGWYRRARAGVKRIEILIDSSKDPLVVAARPIDDSAVRPAPLNMGIERPERLAGGGAHRECLVGGRVGIQYAVDHDWLCLQAARFTAVVRPRDLQLLHVG